MKFLVRLEDKQRALRYYATRSDSYGRWSDEGVLRSLRHKERKLMMHFAAFTPGLTMIDIGCGPGFYALQAKRYGMRVCAMDAVPAMLDQIRDRVDQVYLADLETFRCELRYDRVICAGVLDFVVDPEQSFCRLSRLVAPGGRLVVLAPKEGLFTWLYSAEKRLARIRVNRFNAAWFRGMAGQMGLELLESASPLPFNIAAVLQRPVEEQALGVA
jgi:ubiquinone/menaquinone biosynthesis C-methylase UbiE